MSNLKQLRAPANDFRNEDVRPVRNRPPTAMIRESLNSRYDTALAAVESRTCHSWKMALDRSKVMISAPNLGGTQTPQVIVQSAEGCRITDIDDNVYIDLCMGFGSNLLGHAPPVVEHAIINQIHQGWNFGLSSETQLELADLIGTAGPANERVLFCAAGSEATAIAMRAARAHTGKDVIGVFDGAYHGGHDSVLITADSHNPGKKVHIGMGVPDALDETVEPLPYGSFKALQRIRDLKHTLAAVIVEPIQQSFPDSDGGLWLKDLEKTCRDCNVLIILDEITTGFRLAFGGGQERFDLSPDMVTYGKAVAGGLPAGVLAGRANIMKVFSPDNGQPAVFAGSAFAGNPLSVAASLATLSYLNDHRDTVYENLEKSAEYFANSVNKHWLENKIPLHIVRFGSMLRLFLQPGPAKRDRNIGQGTGSIEDAFFVHLLDRGVTLHASRSIHLSTSNTREDIDISIDAMIGASEDCAADGLFRVAM
ncbi:MAG: aminotransferase class III-fold pyridoxal phosphate-dependent enzyme [Alphaproteobacteria bacterium]|nr:aminotransferase class III-fold pyridoxal phosphate-dependent enzyme [Alphaproteobacteria bacterium]